MCYCLCSNLVLDVILPITAKLPEFGYRFVKNVGVSPLTLINSKFKKSSKRKGHNLSCDHIVSINQFTTGILDFYIKVKSSLLMLHDEFTLNKTETTLPLYAFD